MQQDNQTKFSDEFNPSNEEMERESLPDDSSAKNENQGVMIFILRKTKAMVRVIFF